MKQDEHVEVDPAIIGDFGSSDFAIEFTYQGMGGDASPDGSYAALFTRSTQGDPPYSGPSAFVYDDGKVEFRMLSADDSSCCNCCGNQTSTAACEADAECKASVSACCFATAGCDGCTTTCCKQTCVGWMHGGMSAAPRRLRFENFAGRISFSTKPDFDSRWGHQYVRIHNDAIINLAEVIAYDADNNEITPLMAVMGADDNSCCNCCGGQASTAACEADAACKASVSACCFASAGCDGCTTTCCKQIAASECINRDITDFCHSRTADANPWLRINYGAGAATITRVAVHNRNTNPTAMLRIKGATLSVTTDEDGENLLWESTFNGQLEEYQFDSVSPGAFFPMHTLFLVSLSKLWAILNHGCIDLIVEPLY
jgi:hypothetical protein